MNPNRVFPISFILITLLSVQVQAGPLYDPFLEQFQVGRFGDPGEVTMDGLWPAGLMEPPVLDEHWQQGARQLLAEGIPSDNFLTLRFLHGLERSPVGDLSALRESLEQLINPRLEASQWVEWAPGHPWLGKAVWQRHFFHHLDQGRLEQARLFLLQREHGPVQLTEREEFVWLMRKTLLGFPTPTSVSSGPQTLDTPWVKETDLGPFDRAQVWSLWVAHARATGQSIIPSVWNSRDEAALLAGLRTPYFGREELEASSFGPEIKAGLGATLFTKDELAEHLKAYPHPPADFTVQGWWVKGVRFSSRGQADQYEKLAARTDIFPGWKMDVLRRASELRLLKGQWAQGLKNLRGALDIAAQDGGSLGLRRLLRYWTEQAAALALAEGRPETAWQLLDWGDETFKGASLVEWEKETAHWRAMRLGQERSATGWSDIARKTVDSGQASPVRKRNPQLAKALKTAGEQPLWDLWVKWGIALADPAPLSGDRLTRAIAYASQLAEFDPAASGNDLPPAALQAIVTRLESQPEILAPLLTKVIDRDVCRLSGWKTSPMPSPVPGLLPLLRRSQLDMHAALGVALATGDMRGILAIAYELPGTGLTPQEKRRFLYPLPAEGPIREAILAAGSEPALILAVARNESLFEPAIRSRAGALGWMQIMPFHFPESGANPGTGNWAIPANSIAKGDGLLVENSQRYGGDPYRTLAAYNAGPGAADRWLRQLGGEASSDIYLAWIGYTETRNYVEKVLIDREIYDGILADQP
nr:transglycosylase SLT domain-containing protein [Candidatus Krumholzibacteria bacterium]